MSEARVGVVVVGMHRSGTTAVTRTINLMGVPTCREDDLASGWVGNPAGHWESLTLMRIDDRLLRELGAAWWCPPPLRDDLWSSRRMDGMRGAARLELEAAHPTPQWVAKDPRICITLPFWRRTLDRPLVAVLVLRHPLEVAASHASRDSFPLPFGLALWERYMHHALRGIAGLPVLVARYDELLADPLAWMEQAAAFLGANGVTATPGDPAGIVDPSLRHEQHERGPEAAMSVEQRALAVVLEGLEASPSLELPALPLETGANDAMFERLRRHRGVARRWRWRRYLNRDRNAVLVRERDLLAPGSRGAPPQQPTG